MDIILVALSIYLFIAACFALGLYLNHVSEFDEKPSYKVLTRYVLLSLVWPTIIVLGII